VHTDRLFRPTAALLKISARAVFDKGRPTTVNPPPALAIAPPDIPTASSAAVVGGVREETVATSIAAEYRGPVDEMGDLIEEPMDYTPIAPGRLAALDHPQEVWPDEAGPFGF
jgi:hypothetical protein